MDDVALLKMSGMSAGSLAILLLVYRLLKSAVGKKFVSDCCGRRGEVGFTVRSMSAENIAVEVDDKDTRNPYYKGGSTEGRTRGTSSQDTSSLPRQEGTHKEGDSGEGVKPT